MQAYQMFMEIIQSVFIRGLFVSVLSIIAAGKIFKSDIRNALAIIKSIILVYAGLTIVYYLIEILTPTKIEADAFGQRFTGPYGFAYYMMLVPNTILPLLLFFKKLGRNKYVLLALSFLMNIGWMFEVFVIYTTDLHRNITHLSYNYIWFILLLKGPFVGSVIYAISKCVKTDTMSIPQIKA